MGGQAFIRKEQETLADVAEWARCAPSRVNMGSDYTDEESAFLLAIQKYKKEHNRLFPSFVEVLAVAKSMGYRKVEVDPQSR